MTMRRADVLRLWSLAIVAVSLSTGACTLSPDGQWIWLGQQQNQNNQPKPVTKKTGDTDRDTADDSRVAKGNSTNRRGNQGQLAPTAQRENKPGEVNRNVDQYVSSMPPPRNAEYVPNDAMSKIERQQDPLRQQRLREAAARSTVDEEESDAPEDVKPTVATRSARSEPSQGAQATKQQKAPVKRPAPMSIDEEPMPTGRNEPLVQKASTGGKLPPNVPTEKSEPTEIKPAPRHDPMTESSPTGTKKINPAKTLQPDVDQPEIEQPAAKPKSAPRAATESEDAPVLKNINVSAGKEPAQTPVKKAEQPPEPKSNIAANTASENKLSVDDAIKQRLKQQQELVAKDPNNLEEQFRLRMMYLINAQDDKALATIPGLDADLQEIISAQVKALMSARSGAKRDPATWANKQLEAVEALRRLVRAKADLKVPVVAMCTGIEGFGRYTPLDPAEYSSGKTNYILVYIEVDNFANEKTASAMYRALLSLRYSLINQAGEEIFSRYDENIEDLARAPRQDFFLTIGPIALPKQLPAGEYTLKVEVEDVIGGKINSNQVRFKVVS